MKKLLLLKNHQSNILTAITLILLGALSLTSGNMVKGQAVTLAEDNAGNYSAPWSLGDNGGLGFGTWDIIINTDGGFAGNFIGDPSAAGINGMSATSFGLFANPDNLGNNVTVKRDFNDPLPLGATFSFQWGVNWDAENSVGNKGFNLFAGGVFLLNIEHRNSDIIYIKHQENGALPMFNIYGTNAMTINLQRTGTDKLRVFATGRNGSEVYDNTFTLTSETLVPDNFEFYAAGLNGGDQRQPYFNNLLIAGPEIQYANIESTNEVVQSGNSLELISKFWIPGITGSGVLADILVDIGYSSVDATSTGDFTGPDWNWVEASYLDDVVNDTRYSADIGSAITTPGSYFFVSRLKYQAQEHKYGGYSATGGGFWDGTNNVSGILTVTGLEVPTPPATVKKNQPFPIDITSAIASTGPLNGSYLTTVDALPQAGGDEIPLSSENRNYTNGTAGFDITLPQAGTFDLRIRITVPSTKGVKNEEILEIIVPNVKSEPFDATAGQFQFRGIPFTISVTEATNQSGNALQGSFIVSVVSLDELGFASEGEIFNDFVSFTNGQAAFETALQLTGKHKLEVTLETALGPESMIIPQNIQVFDFSDFTILNVDFAVSDPVYIGPAVYDGKEFDLQLRDVVDATNSPITEQRMVTITSNKIGGNGIVFEDSVNFTVSGADIAIQLTNNDVTGTVEHDITVTIEGVSETKQFKIEVLQNNADFTISGYYTFEGGNYIPLDPATRTAGDPFFIRIEDLLNISGSQVFSDINVRITSNLQDDVLERSNVPITGDVYYLLVNEAENETVFVSGDHTLTVYIEDFGVTKTTDSGTPPAGPINMLAGEPDSFIIIQQPEDIEGNFDGLPASLSTIIVGVTDKFGNNPIQSPEPLDFARIELYSSPQNAVLTGSGVTGNIFFGFQETVSFTNLTLDTEGDYLLRIYGSFLPDTTVLFSISGIEDQSGFEIANPGPQTNSYFQLPLINIKNNEGALISDLIDANVKITLAYEGGPFDVTEPEGYTEQIDVVDGISYLNIEIIVDDGWVFDNDLEFTIFVELDGIQGTEEITILHYLNDLSDFTASIDPPGPQIVGNPFDISITNARDVSDALLNGRLHQVTVFSDLQGTEFIRRDSILFTNGTATLNDVILSVINTHELTVLVDWVKTEGKIENVQVNPGILIRNEADNQLTIQSPHVFPSLTVGYSQSLANTIRETITIESLAGIDITGLSVSDPANFTVTQPVETTLTPGAPITTFTIVPDLGLLPGTWESNVTVNYTLDGDNYSQSFNVVFLVDDLNQFGLTEDGNPVGPNDDLNLGALILNYSLENAVSLLKTITITNTGTGDITDLAVAKGGSHPGAFTLSTLSQNNLNDIEGQTSTFTIRPYHPSDDGGNPLLPGTYESIITVSSAEAPSVQFIVRIVIAENPLGIALNPAGSLFIGLYSVDYLPNDAERQITVTNTGTVNLTSSTQIMLDGLQSGSFVLSTETPITDTNTIPPGGSFVFTVKPVAGLGEEEPEAVLFHEATISILPNGSTDVGIQKDLIVQFLVDNISWTGEISNNWNLSSNWKPATYENGSWPEAINPTVPNRFANIIISQTDRNPILSSQNIRTRSLTIQNAATLTVQNTGVLTVDAGGTLDVDAGGELIVSNLVTNNGTLSLDDTGAGGALTINPTGRFTSTDGIVSNPVGNLENFVIESSSAGTGSVLLGNNGVFGRVERWMKGGAHLHLLSAPVNGQDIATFLSGNGGSSVVSIREFNEGTHTWSAWGTYTAGNFTQGRGYILVRNVEGTLDFKGELKQGLGSFTARRDRFGWNAVGNPYPSGMIVNSFLFDNMIHMQSGFKAVYVYDYAAQSGERYKAINLVDGPRILSNMQGFFVRVGELNDSGSEHILSFTNVMRAHSTGAEYFKSDDDELTDWHLVRIIMEVPDNRARTTLAFNEFMTEGIDEGYDAAVMGFDNTFSIYTQATGFDHNLSIRALPVDFENILVPLGMAYGGTEDITLRADKQDLPDYLTPLLFDAHTGLYTEITSTGFKMALGEGAASGRYFIKMQDSRINHQITYGVAGIGGEVMAESSEELLTSGTLLPEGSAVVFTAIPWAGYAIDHWLVNGVQTGIQDEIFLLDRLLGDTYVQVVFTDAGKFDGALDTGKLPAGEVNMYVADERIIIEGILEENTKGMLFDIMGRKILEENLETGPSNVIPVKGLQEGYYILHLVSDSKHKTKRLFIR